jgi:hypothetical protein
MEVNNGKVMDRRIASYLLLIIIKLLNANALIIQMKYIKEIQTIFLYLEVILLKLQTTVILIQIVIAMNLEHILNSQNCQINI